MRKKLARYRSPDQKFLKSEGYGRREKKQMSRARLRLRKADVLAAGRHDWALRRYLRGKRQDEKRERALSEFVIVVPEVDS